MATLRYNQNKGSDLISMSEAAVLAGVSYSRYRKTVQRLQTPVTRIGWNILIDRSDAKSVKRAIDRGEIRRGRPKKKSRNGSNAEPARVQDE